MALNKRNYVDGETVITAQNLNDIQDEIKNNTIANVTYNSSTRKIQKVSNGGTATDVLTLGNLATLSYVTVTS